MQILLIAATANEISPTIEWLKNDISRSTEVLITGIGSTATAFALTKKLCRQRPDLVIQAGIGGSFTPLYPPGSLVLIDEEVIADLGAIEQNQLTDIFDMGFTGINEKPFANRKLPNSDKDRYKGFGLGFAAGATVNSISSTPLQVSIIKEKYDPAIESMEGAALHYVCLMENISFIQLRAVSNFVGERNKANWKIKDAIHNLNDQLKIMISSIAAMKS